jgi:hypothetical protein
MTARRAAHAADPLIAPELPGYFIDRYALRELLGQTDYAESQLGMAPAGDRATFLATAATPASRLHGWAPAPHDLTGASGLYSLPRQRWKAFTRRAGLPAALSELPDARSLTWQQVMDDSVFYPGPPVFRGATFIDQLTDVRADALLSTVGPEGIIDFYCLMLQVHETVHRHQTGEPLLNEVVQAALWSRFLTEESLWAFQQGSDSSLIRETPVVDRYPVLADAAIAANLDTARMIASIAADNAYFACCMLAYRFDHGAFRYAEYLTRLNGILSCRRDKTAIRALSTSLL